MGSAPAGDFCLPRTPDEERVVARASMAAHTRPPGEGTSVSTASRSREVSEETRLLHACESKGPAQSKRRPHLPVRMTLAGLALTFPGIHIFFVVDAFLACSFLPIDSGHCHCQCQHAVSPTPSPRLQSCLDVTVNCTSAATY